MAKIRNGYVKLETLMPTVTQRMVKPFTSTTYVARESVGKEMASCPKCWQYYRMGTLSSLGNPKLGVAGHFSKLPLTIGVNV